MNNYGTKTFDQPTAAKPINKDQRMEVLRQTNIRLNRRCQKAESELCKANKSIKSQANRISDMVTVLVNTNRQLRSELALLRTKSRPWYKVFG